MIGGRGNPEILTAEPAANSRGLVVRIVGSGGSIGAVPVAATEVDHTSVAANVASVQLLAENLDRLNFSISNDTVGAVLYIRLHASAATTSNWAAKLQPGGYFEPPVNYTGEVRGIWSAAEGSARIAEYT